MAAALPVRIREELGYFVQASDLQTNRAAKWGNP
jgi:hypothetical protein